MTGRDAAPLVITGGITGKFQNLGGKVLENRSKVDGGTGTHALGILSITEVTTDTTDGKLQSYCINKLREMMRILSMHHMLCHVVR